MARNNWVAPINLDSRGISADGLTLATFTAAASVFPDVVLPPNFFTRGRGLNLKARGIWAATGTPTYTFSVKIGSVVVCTTAAITVSAITNQAWELDVDVNLATEGPTGTLLAQGDMNMGGVAGGAIYLPATGTAPAPSGALDLTTSLNLALQVACSVSSASNTVKGFRERVLSIDYA
jgi:hypothetical protein